MPERIELLDTATNLPASTIRQLGGTPRNKNGDPWIGSLLSEISPGIDTSLMTQSRHRETGLRDSPRMSCPLLKENERALSWPFAG